MPTAIQKKINKTTGVTGTRSRETNKYKKAGKRQQSGIERRLRNDTRRKSNGGKDSAVLIDLCFKYFKNVKPFFMYVVRGLEFQERTLRYYEERYDTEIIRVPHFMLSDFIRYGSFRMPDREVPIIKTVELYDYLREQTGVYWIAAGERIADSPIRRAMIKQSSSVDEKRGRFYPLAYWYKADVMSHLRFKGLPLSLESRVLGFSFRSFLPKELELIRKNFPQDFEKIKQDFPLIEASIKWGEYHGNRKISGV